MNSLDLLEKENNELSKQLEKQRDINAHVQEIIASNILKLKPPKVSYPKVRTKNDEEMILLPLSDLHVGAKITLKETGGLEEFAWDIFKQRMDTYKHSVYRITNEIIRKSYPVNDCLLMFLGDTLEGEDVFRNQSFRLDLLGMEQIIWGANELAGLLSYLSGMFRNVRVECISGNHATPKGAVTIDYDLLAYTLMKHSLARHENVSINISEEPFHQVVLSAKDRDDWKLLMMHGDGIMMSNSIPFYGIERRIAKVISATKSIPDYSFLGHFHIDAQLGTNNLNGSWVGPTEYTISKGLMGGRPMQRMFGFHPHKGITFSFPIHLTGE